ncbi:MAG: polysaccharide biosynthesis tyrosine autokinase, partial [Deltaproteobacteria bacterium]
LISGADGGAAQVTDMVKTKMEGLHKTQESLAKFKALKGHEKIESIAMGPEFTEDSLVKKLKEDLAVLEGRDAEMDALYSKNYPIRRLLRKKIQFLRKRIADLEHSAVSFALDAAKKKESLLKEAFDGAKKEASKVSGLSARYALLKKNVDTNFELHKILLKEHKEMDIRSRIALNNVTVVDPPSLPADPVWPRRGLFMVGGLFVALLGGIVVAFIVEPLDKTVQSTELVEREFKVPSLGVVPDVSRLNKFHDRRAMDAGFEFLAYDYPKSPVSDAIRNIESSILFSSMNTGVKCVVVSSASPGEGKTFIAVSLAALLTCGGTKNVCLVDCDLRRPRIHSVFDEGPNTVGLTTLLTMENAHTENVMKAHRIPGLFYMTSGPLIPDHLPLLMSERFEDVIDELRARFDFVILDAPPILGFPDTRILSRQADGVALVARQGHVSRTEYRTAAEMIASTNGGRILGVILNKARVHGSGYGYGSYYYTSSHEYYARAR